MKTTAIVRRAAALTICLVAVAATPSHASDKEPGVVIRLTTGYIRIHDTQLRDTRNFTSAVDETSASAKWKLEAMQSSGDDDYERTEYVFKDTAGNVIRLDWVQERGQDIVLLVSAKDAVRTSATQAIWSKLLSKRTTK